MHLHSIQPDLTLALRNSDGPQIPRRRRDQGFGAVIQILEVAPAQIESAEGGAQRHHFPESQLGNWDGVEMDDLEGGEEAGAPVVHVGDADAAEREVDEAGAGQGEVEGEVGAELGAAQLDVEVLGAAVGGVQEESLELRRAELHVVDDEGKTVEAAARAALQRVEHLVGDVAGADMDIAGRCRVPAVLPEAAPPLVQRRRADGVLDRQERQDAMSQVDRQVREADADRRPSSLLRLLESAPLLIQPLPLLSARAVAVAVGAERHPDCSSGSPPKFGGPVKGKGATARRNAAPNRFGREWQWVWFESDRVIIRS
jgi:hypothetical protein